MDGPTAAPKFTKKTAAYGAVCLALVGVIAFRMMPTKRPSRPPSSEPAKVFEGTTAHYHVKVPHGSLWKTLRPDETPWLGSDLALRSDDGMIVVTAVPAAPEATLEELVGGFLTGASLSDVVETSLPGKSGVLVQGKTGARADIEIIAGLYRSGDTLFSVVASVDPKASIETVGELQEMVRGFEPPPATTTTTKDPAPAPPPTASASATPAEPH